MITLVTNDEISSKLKSKKSEDEKLSKNTNIKKLTNNSVFCTECGTENTANSKYCSECGTLIKYNNYSTKEKRNSWTKQIVTYTAIWGVINLLVASPLFGGVLIFFAILIYASKSFKAIYAFGVIWLLLALIQLITGTFYAKNEILASQGYLLIVLSFVNFGFGGWAIYKTRKLEEEGTLPESPFSITQIRCPECDEKVEKKDKYCLHCGEKLLWNWKD